jgi:iron complex transport system substrate-binding protein
MRVERQKPVAIEVDGLRFADAFRADLVVDGRVLVELKSVERLASVHHRQVLTYLRLLDFPIGLLINFGEARLNSGLHRVVNPRASTRAPVLSSG